MKQLVLLLLALSSHCEFKPLLSRTILIYHDWMHHSTSYLSRKLLFYPLHHWFSLSTMLNHFLPTIQHCKTSTKPSIKHHKTIYHPSSLTKFNKVIKHPSTINWSPIDHHQLHQPSPTMQPLVTAITLAVSMTSAGARGAARARGLRSLQHRRAADHCGTSSAGDLAAPWSSGRWNAVGYLLQ